MGDRSLRGLASDARLTIARRDMASLRREKTIVLALLIQLFVAAFSSFLVVGLTSLYDPGSMAGGEVELGITGEASEELLAATSSQRAVRPIQYGSTETATAAFEAGRIDGILAASRVPGPDGGTRLSVDATAPSGNLRTTMVVVQIRRVLSELERTERAERANFLETQPLAVPPRVDASPYFGFTYTILLPLLLFLPPFISGSVAVDVLTEEIERGTLELLRVAPVSLLDIVDGKAIGMILIAPVQAALWLALLAINGIAVANPLILLVLVTALATIVTVLGLSLGLQTGVRRQAQLLYSVLAIALFGSALLLPEHPATTVAKLAVGSATDVTFAHVAGFVLVALGAVAFVRRYAARIDPAGL